MLCTHHNYKLVKNVSTPGDLLINSAFHLKHSFRKSKLPQKTFKQLHIHIPVGLHMMKGIWAKLKGNGRHFYPDSQIPYKQLDARGILLHVC